MAAELRRVRMTMSLLHHCFWDSSGQYIRVRSPFSSVDVFIFIPSKGYPAQVSSISNVNSDSPPRERNQAMPAVFPTTIKSLLTQSATRAVDAVAMGLVAGSAFVIIVAVGGVSVYTQHVQAAAIRRQRLLQRQL